MTSLRRCAGVLSLLVCFAATRRCDAQVSVIAHPSFPGSSISSRELSRLFLGEYTAIKGGVRVVLVAQAAAQRIYMRSFLRMSEDEFKRHWIREMFTGRPVTPPVVVATLDEAVTMVQNAPGAIAFVVGRPDGRIKVLQVDGHSADHPAYPVK